ncbi:hypothetical protein PYW08_014855 [Mythimna loreyi]|uniref:Uncharacterized protein n=1 Tax=Mythimna loreyi TaxID=667449 RepID=A0ACC2R5A1_9NEOP|nr:hypothetical protein PYW08_014855 [Mythimna loreyi]
MPCLNSYRFRERKSPVCGVSRNSDKGHVLKDCSLIVWDELTMANRKAVEAEDRTLQDIRGNEHLMGGVTVCSVAISGKRYSVSQLRRIHVLCVRGHRSFTAPAEFLGV